MVGIDIPARLEKVKRQLAQIDELDTTAIHADLGEEMRNIIEQRFDDGRDPSGKPWTPIKTYFNRDHNRLRTPADTPLKLKDLYKSFSYNASAEQVLIGTNREYAKYHTDFPNNNGAPRRKIPLREFMGIENAQDFDLLLDVIEFHLERSIN